MNSSNAGLEQIQIKIELTPFSFRKNFPFVSKWKGKYYEIKQVMPIVTEKDKEWIVITVYVFYFGGETQ